jgi:uncharacterized protein (DUF952 family)
MSEDTQIDILYHLVQKQLWDACKESNAVYYPPTYHTDGFTHATADPAKLLAVANHFYKDIQGEWLCLVMTSHTLTAAGIAVKFEDPAPVGSKPAHTSPEGVKFPHIYGGIPSQVVTEERSVARASDGSFLFIEGLITSE